MMKSPIQTVPIVYDLCFSNLLVLYSIQIILVILAVWSQPFYREGSFYSARQAFLKKP